MATAKKAAKKSAAKTRTAHDDVDASLTADTESPTAAKKTATKKTAAKKTAAKKAATKKTATKTAGEGAKTAARAAKTAAVAQAQETRKDINPEGSWPFPTGKRP